MESKDAIALQYNYTFDTQEVIKRGGFGHVSVIMEKQSGLEFALKTVHKGVTNKRNISIKREKVALQSIQHPNIIKLEAVFESDKSVYFLMELMTERDMYDWCSKTGGLPMDSVRYYTAELVLALDYLRSQGYVHRDVKSKNVLLSPTQHVKLADFGSARRITDSKGRCWLAGDELANSPTGTPYYNPPEITFRGPVTYSTDLWGLASVISEMYCGDWVCERRHNETHQQYYDRVDANDFQFRTANPDLDLLDLIGQLTKSCASIRIGAVSIAQLQYHAFFTPISWRQLPITPPPPLPPPPAGFDHRNPHPHMRPRQPKNPNTKQYPAPHSVFDSLPPKHFDSGTTGSNIPTAYDTTATYRRERIPGSNLQNEVPGSSLQNQHHSNPIPIPGSSQQIYHDINHNPTTNPSRIPNPWSPQKSSKRSTTRPQPPVPTFGLVSTTKKGESIFDFPQGRPELRHRLSPAQEVYEFDQEAWDQITEQRTSPSSTPPF